MSRSSRNSGKCLARKQKETKKKRTSYCADLSIVKNKKQQLTVRLDAYTTQERAPWSSGTRSSGVRFMGNGNIVFDFLLFLRCRCTMYAVAATAEIATTKDVLEHTHRSKTLCIRNLITLGAISLPFNAPKPCVLCFQVFVLNLPHPPTCVPANYCLSWLPSRCTSCRGNSVQNDDKKHDHLIRQLSDADGDYKDDTVPFTSWRNTLDTLRYALAFFVLLVADHPLGRCFPHCFKLPLIAGYLVIGIIAGPFVANLLTQNLVDALSTYVTTLALSFFSFQTGQEIYLPELRPQLKSIVILLSVLYGTTMVLLTSAILRDESSTLTRYNTAMKDLQSSRASKPKTIVAVRRLEKFREEYNASLSSGKTWEAEACVESSRYTTTDRFSVFKRRKVAINRMESTNGKSCGSHFS
ncbi:hypothetical protein PsorP6_008025 [Peronosclerospora sorghi]|uniref:Uncharacterized protein n=1 Tax=Peronosclerospora sorghi TaxID=230839 RepID=A0ACC0WCL6_9STRA|nr:hypothetical protein PsorP6_008025 [Peronosclerospora sorghi]